MARFAETLSTPTRTAGVLHAGNLKALRVELGAAVHIGHLATATAHYDRRQLWVMPDAAEALGLGRAAPWGAGDPPARAGHPHPFVADAMAEGWRCYPPGLAAWMVCQRGPVNVAVVFPGWDQGSPLGEASPGELLEALELYQRAVGLPYERRPATMGARVLRDVHRRGLKLPASSTITPPPALEGATERDEVWVRALNAEELERPWVHAFDVNGLYLAAASSVALGLGDPSHVVGPHASLDDFGRIRALGLPGYWRTVLHPPGAVSRALPDPFGPRGPGSTRSGVWLATPRLVLALELGQVRAIREAWVYTERSRYLEPWYERLRGARTATMEALELGQPGAELANRLVKQTYAFGIGALAGWWLRPGDELYRPDWRHQVIARARANLYRRLLKCEPRNLPFAVEVDCLYVASRSPDPEAAAAWVGLPLGPGLGLFKHAGTAPMGAVLEVFNRRGAGRERVVGATVRPHLPAPSPDTLRELHQAVMGG